MPRGDRLPPRDVQVRARRASSSTFSGRCTSSGWTRPSRVRGRTAVEVAPRDLVAAALPDPATLGDRMRGKTCAGTSSRARARTAAPRAVYLYHVADNERTMREYGHQAVVLQTALNPVDGPRAPRRRHLGGDGRARPRVVRRRAFLELLADYGEPHGVVEGDPASSASVRAEGVRRPRRSPVRAWCVRAAAGARAPSDEVAPAREGTIDLKMPP